MAVLLITIIIPLFVAGYLSLTRYDLFSAPQFVGFENYSSLFSDPLFYKSIGNTLYFALGQVLIGVVVAFFVAMLFNNKLVAGGAMRTTVYLPQAMSYVTVALLWTFLYDPYTGPINALLVHFGWDPISFLSEVDTAMPSIMAMSLWRNLGYFMIILLAGLKAVPVDLIEASQIDGAGWFRRLFNVILPQMVNPLFFVTVTWFMGGLQMFTQAYVMTQGGPIHSTRTIVYHMYDSAFAQMEIGKASAVAVLMFLAVMVVALPIRLLSELKGKKGA